MTEEQDDYFWTNLNESMGWLDVADRKALHTLLRQCEEHSAPMPDALELSCVAPHTLPREVYLAIKECDDQGVWDRLILLFEGPTEQ